MEPSDLRLGNIVYHHPSGEIHAITAQDLLDGEERPLEGWQMIYKPVMLTSKWIEKLGFDYVKGNAVKDDYCLSNFDEIWHSNRGLFIENDGGQFILYEQTDEDTYNQLRWLYYVHELQNGYHWMKKEELPVYTDEELELFKRPESTLEEIQKEKDKAELVKLRQELEWKADACSSLEDAITYGRCEQCKTPLSHENKGGVCGDYPECDIKKA